MPKTAYDKSDGETGITLSVTCTVVSRWQCGNQVYLMLRHLLHVLYILRVQGWWEGGRVAIRSWSTCLHKATAISSQLTNVSHSCFTSSMSKQEHSALKGGSITSKCTSLTSLCRVEGQIALRDCGVISQHPHVSIVQQHVSLQVKYYCCQVCIPLRCTLL